MSKIAIWVLVGIIFVGGGYYALNVAKNSDSKLQDYSANELDSNILIPENNNQIQTPEIIKPENIPPQKENDKITLAPDNKKLSCESQKGTWYEESKVCEINSFSENQCIAKGGEWNGCASACRHDKDAQICTLQCVLTCSFR